MNSYLSEYEFILNPNIIEMLNGTTFMPMPIPIHSDRSCEQKKCDWKSETDNFFVDKYECQIYNECISQYVGDKYTELHLSNKFNNVIAFASILLIIGIIAKYIYDSNKK